MRKSVWLRLNRLASSKPFVWSVQEEEFGSLLIWDMVVLGAPVPSMLQLQAIHYPPSNLAHL